MAKQSRMVARVWVGLLAVALVSAAASAVPVSDGSLFTDDFGTGDLSKWARVEGDAVYDGAVGNPAGSIGIATQTPTEGFARPNMYWADQGQTEWVTEFDIKVNDSTGGGFLIYAAYAPDWAAIDVEVNVATHDWLSDFYGPGQDAWDFHVYDNGWVNHSVVARLRADQWHHFIIHRIAATGVVDLYVDGDLKGTYNALSLGVLGNAQIGDVTLGGMWGNVHWDNFSIGVPEPATVMLLSIGCCALLRRRTK